MRFEVNSAEGNDYYGMLFDNGFNVMMNGRYLYIEINDLNEMMRMINVVGYQIIVNNNEIIVYDGYME